mmetsp:Transcript_41239/g.93271  ORF Transcript_41239/g.93271 Transcript_41239/m.93271 type:complete len:223 (-) Transcript_41239:1451-2119(-)
MEERVAAGCTPVRPVSRKIRSSAAILCSVRIHRSRMGHLDWDSQLRSVVSPWRRGQAAWYQVLWLSKSVTVTVGVESHLKAPLTALGTPVPSVPHFTALSVTNSSAVNISTDTTPAPTASTTPEAPESAWVTTVPSAGVPVMVRPTLYSRSITLASETKTVVGPTFTCHRHSSNFTEAPGVACDRWFAAVTTENAPATPAATEAYCPWAAEKVGWQGRAATF